MRNRSRILVAATAALLVLVTVYFEPTHCVRGWLHGEAFFEGRPTSYWRGIVEDDLQIDPHIFIVSPMLPPEPTFWERCKDWIGYQPQIDSSWQLMANPQAEGVLRELMRDQNAKIAGFAKDVPERGLEEEPMSLFYWMRLIEKHNIKYPASPKKDA